MVSLHSLKTLGRKIRLYRNWHIVVLSVLGIVRGESVAVLRNGVKYKIRGGSSDRSVIDEVWDKHVYDFDNESIGNSWVVVDIGGHIGAFGVYAAHNATIGKVFCYEPDNENFRILSENIKLNCLDNIKVFKLAVTGSAGKRRLYVCDHNPGGHTMFADQYSNYEVVDCITLGDTFKLNNIEFCDLLKMNCEGAEFEILLDSPDEVLMKVGKMVFEYHNSKEHHHTDLIKRLEFLGFDILVEAIAEDHGRIKASKPKHLLHGTT